MIEVRFEAGRLMKIVNDVAHHAQVKTALQNLGIPVVGTLWLRTVSRGVLIMFTEEDIDDDTFVWRWYSPSEWGALINAQLPSYKQTEICKKGKGEGYTWAFYSRDPNDSEI